MSVVNYSPPTGSSSQSNTPPQSIQVRMQNSQEYDLMRLLIRKYAELTDNMMVVCSQEEYNDFKAMKDRRREIAMDHARLDGLLSVIEFLDYGDIFVLPGEEDDDDEDEDE